MVCNPGSMNLKVTYWQIRLFIGLRNLQILPSYFSVSIMVQFNPFSAKPLTVRTGKKFLHQDTNVFKEESKLPAMPVNF